MSLYYYVGLVGSGKTYKGVKYLYDAFKDDSCKHYNKFKVAYTNIDGFNYDFFDNKIRHLNFDVLEEWAKLEYNLMQTNKHIRNYDIAINDLMSQIADNIPIEELDTDFALPIKYEKRDGKTQIFQNSFNYTYNIIKGFQFNHALFVIDEAANYLDTPKEHLKRWLNYQRHFYQDLIFIQNQITDIHRSYKSRSVVTSFVSGASPKDRIKSNVFKYTYFSHPQLHKNSAEKQEFVKFDKKIADLYESGQNESAIPVLYKYILFAMIPTVIFIGVLYNILVGFGGSEEPTKEKFIPNDINLTRKYKKDTYSNTERFDLEETKLYCFTCLADLCRYKNHSIESHLFTYYITQYNLVKVSTDSNPNVSYHCFQGDVSFSKLFIDESNQFDKNKSKMPSMSLF